MDELTRFIALAQTERFTLTELCEQFGISRKTAYKHLKRYAVGGFKALERRSSRPLHSPARTDEAITGLILAERRLHRTWGPKKLRVVLETKHGITSPPAHAPAPRLVTEPVQRTLHLPSSVEGMLHVKFVDLLHQFERLVRHRLGLVVAR